MLRKGLVDIYKIGDFYSGLGQFSYHLATELMKHPAASAIDFLIPSAEAVRHFQDGGTGSFVRAGMQKRFFPGLNPGYAFWHCTQQFPSFLPGRHTPMILTIHDLNFMVDKPAAKAAAYLKRLQRNVDRAEVITTISRYTRSEIERNLNLGGRPVHVIYNGIAPHKSTEDVRPGMNVPGKFFFSVGVFKSSKQFHTLLPLMNHFNDHFLVIAGNHQTAYGDLIREGIEKFRLTGRVLLPGTVSEEQKHWLYAHCEAFLFPSVAEGFGMPVVEAMKAGRPVFTTRRTSLPEIGGETVYYFDDPDPESMRDTILAGMNDFNAEPHERQAAMKEQAAQFNWEAAAAAYLNLYKAFL